MDDSSHAPSGLDRLLNRIGIRGAVLLALGGLDFAYAYGLLNPPRPVTQLYQWPEDVAPLVVWAAVWDVIGYLSAVMLKFFWAALLLFGWIGGSIDRGYVNVAVWSAFALVVLAVMGGVQQPAPTSSGAGP
jgi:hypothetical protein